MPVLELKRNYKGRRYLAIWTHVLTAYHDGPGSYYVRVVGPGERSLVFHIKRYPLRNEVT